MLQTVPRYQLDVDRGPNWLLVGVRRATIGRTDPEPFSSRVQSLLEQHLTNRLVVDLHRAGTVTQTLAKELAEIRDWLMVRGGVMRICGPSPHQKEILERHGFGDRFVAYQDLEEAVLGGQQPPAQSP